MRIASPLHIASPGSSGERVLLNHLYEIIDTLRTAYFARLATPALCVLFLIGILVWTDTDNTLHRISLL
jgi:hypothetical protein